MATVAQITANRLNAQRSTGPRTEAGKAVSRFNALSHGLEARSRVIPGEDPAELETLAADYRAQFNPVGPLEDYLVDTLVSADWNRRRYTRAETHFATMLMKLDPDPPAPGDPVTLAGAFDADVTGAKVLQALIRRLDAAQRTYFRALAELRRTQKTRAAQEQEEPGEAGDTTPAPGPRSLAPSSTSPGEIGFVPPIPHVPPVPPTSHRTEAPRPRLGAEPPQGGQY